MQDQWDERFEVNMASIQFQNVQLEMSNIIANDIPIYVAFQFNPQFF